MSVQNYIPLSVDMADLPSHHYVALQRSPLLSQHASIVPMIEDFGIDVFMQKLLSTDQY